MTTNWRLKHCVRGCSPPSATQHGVSIDGFDTCAMSFSQVTAHCSPKHTSGNCRWWECFFLPPTFCSEVFFFYLHSVAEKDDSSSPDMTSWYVYTCIRWYLIISHICISSEDIVTMTVHDYWCDFFLTDRGFGAKLWTSQPQVKKKKRKFSDKKCNLQSTASIWSKWHLLILWRL